MLKINHFTIKFKNFLKLASESYSDLYINVINLLVKDFYWILPILLLYSMFYNSYKILLFCSFLKVKEYILKLHVFQKFFSMIEADQKTISLHWSNDFDLQIVRKTSYFLIFLGISGFFYIFFSSLILDLPDSISKFHETNKFDLFTSNNYKYCLFLIIFGVLLDFVGEIHIIFFRNFPVQGKIVSTCVKCGKTAAAGVALVTLVKVPLSYVPGVEPTFVGNTYQQHFGRGYGFSTGRDHLHHFSFQNLPEIKSGEVSMSNFLTEDKKYSLEKANNFIQQPKNLAWAKKNLSVMDCQNLGFNKGYIA